MKQLYMQRSGQFSVNNLYIVNRPQKQASVFLWQIV